MPTLLEINEDTVQLHDDGTISVKAKEKAFGTLVPVSAECVFKLRLTKVPTLVVKFNNQLYATKVKRGFSSSAMVHLCPDCKYCHALPVSEGGCNKVSAISFEMVSKYPAIDIPFGEDPMKIVLEDAKRIEKYPFIVSGLETFNVSSPSLVVCQCSRFQMDDYSPKNLEL
jgi:hypothetical protein